MAWIRVVPPGDGGAELDELFERVRDPASGRLDNINRIADALGVTLE